MTNTHRTFQRFATAFVLAGLFLATGLVAQGSSHREAPMISGDPKVDATDLYAFVSPDDEDTVTLIANYIPLEEPSGGPNYFPFDDNARYEINIDNNGDAEADITYRFEFDTEVRNPNTFLYTTGPVTSLDDENWNVRQTYTLTKIEDGRSEVMFRDVPTTPSNVGPKSIPDFGELRDEAIHEANGMKVYAGQSEDPFFVDLGATFDLLTIRDVPGNKGGGVNILAGYNVNSLALQIPTEDLTDGDAVIGVWTTASRQSTRVLKSNPSNNSTTGDWVQVSRLGAPLVNEVVVPLAAKDLFNASQPKDDAQFADGVANPELATLIKSIYNIDVPPQGKFGSSDARDDLIAIFLTGIPELTMPKNVKASEMLRLNTSIMPTKNPNRMGVLGGDNQGYPNGRRLADDVVDISLEAVAGAAYPLFHKDFTADPLAAKLGDGVDSNENGFSNSFPYLAMPYDGVESRPHANAVSGTSNGSDTSNLQSRVVSLQSELIKLLLKFIPTGK